MGKAIDMMTERLPNPHVTIGQLEKQTDLNTQLLVDVMDLLVGVTEIINDHEVSKDMKERLALAKKCLEHSSLDMNKKENEKLLNMKSTARKVKRRYKSIKENE